MVLRTTCGALLLLISGGAALFAQPQFSAPVIVPPGTTSSWSIIGAGGAGTTAGSPPSFALGVGMQVSSTSKLIALLQTSGVSPSVLIGAITELPQIAWGGKTLTPFAGAAYGAAWSSVASIKLTGSPATDVAALSTNANFQQCYLAGFAYKPPGRWAYGIGAKYIRTAGGVPAQTIPFLYAEWGGFK